MRLLSHYWLANENEALRRAQAQDWVDDLREFDRIVVECACREWRQTQTRRPMIAEIRKLCVEQRDYIALKATLPPPSTPGNYRPPDHVIRDDFKNFPVRDWSRAELDTAWNMTEAKMIAEGFAQLPDESNVIWHSRYARVKLAEKAKATNKIFSPLSPIAKERKWETASLTPERLSELTGKLPPLPDVSGDAAT